MEPKFLDTGYLGSAELGAGNLGSRRSRVVRRVLEA